MAEFQLVAGELPYLLLEGDEDGFYLVLEGDEAGDGDRKLRLEGDERGY